MGVTFKENVEDIRNSKVVDVVNELHAFNVEVDVIDPYAKKEEVEDEYNFTLKDNPEGRYDGVILAVNHKPYLEYDENYFKSILIDGGVLIDVKGVFKNKFENLNYWSL